MDKGLSRYSQPKQTLESLTILERIAQGDELAVNECIDTYGNLIWGIAKRNTKTGQDAEDAVQEIFIDIWKSTRRFDPTKSPEVTFIILIAKRRLLDRLRKFYRRPQVLSFENVRESQASNTHKQLQQYVELRFAFDALGRLKPQQRQVIDMQVFWGMSHIEIAETVRLPLGTVKSQIRRGLKRLRKSIELPNPG